MAVTKITTLFCLSFCVLIYSTDTALAQFSAKNNNKDYVTRLTSQNIKSFLDEVSDITTGRRPDMLDDDVANYFNNHITDKGAFKSNMRYNIPGYPTQDIEMSLDKVKYINTIVKGRHMMENYQTDIEIRDLKISGNGKSATLTSITKEKGNMPFPKDPNRPDDIEMVPIEGVSSCEQRVVISYNNFIQMAEADCKTSINFDPFAGTPLVPE